MEIKLEPENKEKLLHVSSIREFLNSGRAADTLFRQPASAGPQKG
jgi:hypothetical protein